jgi:hypothetical protein
VAIDDRLDLYKSGFKHGFRISRTHGVDY